MLVQSVEVVVTVGVLLHTPPWRVTDGGIVFVVRSTQSGWIGQVVGTVGVQRGLGLVTVLV